MTIASPALLKLLVWLSPAFPVGGYTYSHGLEWAIEDGSVASAADLAAWIADILAHGGGRNDAILFACAHRAAIADDAGRLVDVVETALAFQPSRERLLETTAQGTAFVRAIRDTYPLAGSDRLYDAVEAARDRFAGDARLAFPWPYPVAVAIAAAGHGVPLAPALAAFLQAFVANIVSAGVRAVPLGQTDGLRLVAGAVDRIAALAELAPGLDLDHLGGAALRADIASMRHETQYTRLFRS